MKDHALSVSSHLVEAELSTDVVVAVCRDVGEDGLQLGVEDGPAGVDGGGGEATAVVLCLDRRLAGQRD